MTGHVPSGRLNEILLAALRILQDEGPEALTMRRLAGALGIQAPSLYKHVRDKGVLEGLLQQHAMAEFGRAVGAVGPDGHAVAAAYRRWALENPHLYELAVRGPVRAESGHELHVAAAPLLRAVGGDPDGALAFLGMAHGLVDLELNHHFPPGADIEAAWRYAVHALTAPSGALPERRKRS